MGADVPSASSCSTSKRPSRASSCWEGMVRTLNSPLAVQARLLVVEVLVYGMCHLSLVTGCECPAMHAEGEAMRGWLDCIGLNAAETELLIEEGWAVGDFADMSIEDAVSVLRLRRRVHAWRITRCGYDGWADGGKEGYRDARKAAFELASDGPWQGKSLSLFVRMSPSPESLGPFTHFLQPSLLLFWPWRQAELVVMLEANCSKLPPGACAGAGAAGEHDERTAGNQNWESHQELASSKSLQNMSAEHLDIVRARELLTQNPPHARVRTAVRDNTPTVDRTAREREKGTEECVPKTFRGRNQKRRLVRTDRSSESSIVSGSMAHGRRNDVATPMPLPHATAYTTHTPTSATTYPKPPTKPHTQLSAERDRSESHDGSGVGVTSSVMK